MNIDNCNHTDTEKHQEEYKLTKDIESASLSYPD